FTAWHEFGRLKPADFAMQREGVVQKLRGLSADVLNPLVARAFADAPTTMREVAQRYGALLADAEKQWRALLKASPDAKSLPDESAEALRRVLYGADSPCDVPDEHLANNEWHFPTNTVVELWKLQNDLDRYLLQSAAVPAYATILVDRAQPVTPRVF